MAISEPFTTLLLCGSVLALVCLVAVFGVRFIAMRTQQRQLRARIAKVVK